MSSKIPSLKTKAGRERLERAYCVLVDHEGDVCQALVDEGMQQSSFHDVCRALRTLVDGPVEPPR